MKLLHLIKTSKALLQKLNTLPVRQSVYVGNDRILTTTVYGQKLFVDAKDISLTPHIIIDGYWERWITHAIQKLVRPGMVVVEIGANIGYYTTLFASWVGKQGHVYAFEANPAVFDILTSNMSINGFLPFSTLENRAVFSETGHSEFNIWKNHQGNSRMLACSNEEYLKSFHDTAETITVPTISLDHYWQNKKGAIDFIKIDAEGSEPFIVDGMKHILSSPKPLIIVCEFYKSFFNGETHSAGAFIDNVQSYGFMLNKITHAGEIVPSSRDEIFSTEYEELVFIKR